MKGKLYYILLICLLLIVVSCNTYTVFYSPTVTDSRNLDTQNISRLDLSKSLDVCDHCSSLSNLKMLDMTSRDDLDIEKILKSLPNPESLQVLILDSLKMKRLPATISRFKKLKHLSINHNPDLDFENTIEILKDLPIEFLNTQFNQLTALPSNIADIRTLQELNLSHNYLRGFDHFYQLETLTEFTSLWLTNNNLQNFPESLTTLHQLRNLYIEHNELSDVPESIKHMKRVWTIHVGHNNFVDLPINFGKMPGLLLLHINNNPIASISNFYSSKKNYNFLGLILDNNALTSDTKNEVRFMFDHFFILSVE